MKAPRQENVSGLFQINETSFTGRTHPARAGSSTVNFLTSSFGDTGHIIAAGVAFAV